MQDQPTAQESRDGRKLAKTKERGIYKRDSHYVVRYRDRQGRDRKRIARTLAEARSIKASIKADLDRGEFFVASKVTFEEYATNWLKTYGGRTSRGLRESTKAEYKRAIEQRAVKHFGKARLSEITTPDVKRYIAEVAESGVSASTVRGAYAPVRALFATAVEDGVIRHNPAAGIRLAIPNVHDEAEENVKALTEEQLKALIAATAKEHELLARFLAHTGLRIGEALALRWSDVDFGKRRIKVRRRFYKGEFAPPKSRFGRRDVPLAPSMAHSLWDARKTASAEGDLLFPGRDGEPLAASTVLRAVKAAGKRAGVPWAGLHTLRHTCATMLFRNGANAKQVQLWLGHHSPAFTLATYVHLLPDDLPDPAFFDGLSSFEKDSGAEYEEHRRAARR